MSRQLALAFGLANSGAAVERSRPRANCCSATVLSPMDL